MFAVAYVAVHEEENLGSIIASAHKRAAANIDMISNIGNEANFRS